MRHKKAQLTVFVIVGILMLISVGILVLLKGIKSDIPVAPSVEEIPIMAKPIKRYIDVCVEKVSLEAVKAAGIHGGYVDPFNTNITPYHFSFDKNNPTDSDMASLTGSNDFAIPYWWFLKSSNDCVACELNSLAPTIEQVQKQLEYYINTELPGCLAGYEEFKKQGFSFEEGRINTRALIAENDITITVDYPLTVMRGEDRVVLDKFIYKIPLNFKRIYDLALELTKGEVKEQGIELAVMHLISAYSGLSSSKLPPISAVEEGFNKVIWSKSNVEFKLQDILHYINLLQLNKTRGVSPITSSDPYVENFYNALFLDLLNNSYDNLSVRFIYLGWPFYFEISPRNDELLEPETQVTSYPMGILPPSQTNYYEFFYDLSIPVIVEIRDDSAFSDSPYTSKGYSFFIALEANIRDNIDLTSWLYGNGTLGPWDYNHVTYNLPGEMEVPDQNNPNNTQVVPIRNITKSMFCDFDQAVSGNVTFNVKDASDDSMLEGVSVYFACGDYDTCFIGTTENHTFSSTFPMCIGGHLVFEKEGYMKKKVMGVSTLPGQPLDIGDVYLEPFITKNFTVNKYSMYWAYPNGFGPIIMFPETPDNLSVNDSLMINIKRVKETPYVPSFSQSFRIDSSNYNKPIGIRLVPGKYDVTIIYTDNNGFVIPKKCKHICKGWGCILVDEYIPEDDIEMIPAMMGGVYINNNTGGYWRVSRAELASDKQVEFNIVRFVTPPCLDEMEELGKLENYSKTFYSVLRPRFT